MCVCVWVSVWQRLILSIQGAVSSIWSFENLCKSFNTLQTDHNDKPKAESPSRRRSRSRNDCFEYFTSKHFTQKGGSKLAQNVSLRFALVFVSVCVCVCIQLRLSARGGHLIRLAGVRAFTRQAGQRNLQFMANIIKLKAFLQLALCAFKLIMKIRKTREAYLMAK